MLPSTYNQRLKSNGSIIPKPSAPNWKLDPKD